MIERERKKVEGGERGGLPLSKVHLIPTALYIRTFTAGEAGPASMAVTDSRQDAAATILTSTSTFSTHVRHRFRLLKLFDYSGVNHNRQ